MLVSLLQFLNQISEGILLFALLWFLIIVEREYNHHSFLVYSFLFRHFEKYGEITDLYMPKVISSIMHYLSLWLISDNSQEFVVPPGIDIIFPF